MATVPFQFLSERDDRIWENLNEILDKSGYGEPKIRIAGDATVDDDDDDSDDDSDDDDDDDDDSDDDDDDADDDDDKRMILPSDGNGNSIQWNFASRDPA